MPQLLGLSIGILLALFALVSLVAWWKTRRGGADDVRQLVVLDPDRVLSLEYLHVSGADDGGFNEERCSVRSLTDGRLLARRLLDGELQVVARGGRHLVAVGTRPRVCVLDATAAVVVGETEIKASNPELDDFAPREALAPEVRDGRLSVLSAQGRRVALTLTAAGPIEAVASAHAVFDPRAERRSGMRLGEGSRRQLALRGKAVAGVDFLEGAFLVEPEAPEVLVVHERSLDGGGGLISALDRDGRPRWTTSLDRSLARDARAAVVAGNKLVCALSSRHPRSAELLCLDLNDGALLWRLRP